jgi:hypothetical protein
VRRGSARVLNWTELCDCFVALPEKIYAGRVPACLNFLLTPQKSRVPDDFNPLVGA